MWILKVRKLAKAAGREALLLFFAIRDPGTPLPIKIAAAAALAYLLSPVDLMPDIPLIGWVDDLLLLSYGLPFLIRRLPPRVRERNGERADRVIELLGFGARKRGPAQTVESEAPRRAGASSRGAGTRRRARADVSDARIVSEVNVRGRGAAR